jgi:hypothetical protein
MELFLNYTATDAISDLKPHNHSDSYPIIHILMGAIAMPAIDIFFTFYHVSRLIDAEKKPTRQSPKTSGI